jgi:uncharacterized protein (TIGR02996 family)
MTNNNDRQAFLNSITAAPEDLGLRQVYADWLDEQGLHEEALYQRSWSLSQESRKWIERFADQYDFTYDRIVDAATRFLEHGDYLVDGSRLEGEFVPDEFWEHFEKATGRQVPRHGRENFFSCSC